MKKMIFFIVSLVILIFTSKTLMAQTWNGQVYVSGASLGIKINTEVEVLGTFGIEYEGKVYTPWMDKIYEHDILTKVNGNDIKSASSLIEYIEDSKGKEVDVLIKRDNKFIDTKIKPILNKNKYSLGLYVKDYDMGVGTLTFIEPSTMTYASLGHKMVDKQILGGSVYKSNVDYIIKPRDNQAGEKRATIIGNSVGSVLMNNELGIYGKMYDNTYLSSSTLLNLGPKSEAHKGSAYILTTTSGQNIGKYNIEITQLQNQKKTDVKGIKFKVTDNELLDISGGIVQGMSGSPIIQDNKLIGAVTHVVLANPAEGYGCYAEFMINNLGFGF